MQEFNTPMFSDEMTSILEKGKQMVKCPLQTILKKFLEGNQLTDIQKQQLDASGALILARLADKATTKPKRADEHRKIFYKKAFKYSISKYFKKKSKKSRNMSKFYHNHFGQLSKQLGINLTKFYHPDKKTKVGLNIGHKTFNYTYIKCVLKSNTFKNDCIEYHKKFIQQCIKQRQNKINTFVQKVNQILYHNGYDGLQQYLQSSKWKIPWTDSQIQQSWHRAKFDLEQDFTENDQQIMEYFSMKKAQRLECKQNKIELLDSMNEDSEAYKWMKQGNDSELYTYKDHSQIGGICLQKGNENELNWWNIQLLQNNISSSINQDIFK